MATQTKTVSQVPANDVGFVRALMESEGASVTVTPDGSGTFTVTGVYPSAPSTVSALSAGTVAHMNAFTNAASPTAPLPPPADRRFVGKALPLSRGGLSHALDQLGLSQTQTAELWAVFEAETAGITQGFGFRADRRPQLLFERHKFSTFTNGQFDSEAPDISNSSAGGYGSIAQQYSKLEKAIQLCSENSLDEEAALKSASWGIGQVMGFNHQSAGFATAKDMVEAMVESEDRQLAAMTSFMVEKGLATDLKNHDWAAFAFKYNGAGFAANQYDVKLESHYLRFSSGSMPNLELRTAQAALLLLQFSPGKIDGVMGNRTRDALKQFQVGAGLIASGELDAQSFEALHKKAFS